MSFGEGNLRHFQGSLSSNILDACSQVMLWPPHREVGLHTRGGRDARAPRTLRRCDPGDDNEDSALRSSPRRKPGSSWDFGPGFHWA